MVYNSIACRSPSGDPCVGNEAVESVALRAPVSSQNQIGTVKTFANNGRTVIPSVRASVMILAATDRPDIADTSEATADELRAIWGPLLANAGAYEISGELITIHPSLPRCPS